MNWILLNEHIVEALVSALTAGIAYLVSRARAQKTQHQKLLDIIAAVQSDMPEIRKSVEVLSAALEAQQERQRQLIRGRIDAIHKRFMSIGRIDRHSYDQLAELGESYKQLGGNGYVEKLISDLEALPIVENGYARKLVNELETLPIKE